MLSRNSVWTYPWNEPTPNSSGNTRLQSSQLAEPLWTELPICRIGVRGLIITWKMACGEWLVEPPRIHHYSAHAEYLAKTINFSLFEHMEQCRACEKYRLWFRHYTNTHWGEHVENACWHCEVFKVRIHSFLCTWKVRARIVFSFSFFVMNLPTFVSNTWKTPVQVQRAVGLVNC